MWTCPPPLPSSGLWVSSVSHVITRWHCGTAECAVPPSLPFPPESKGYLACCSNPVIYEVMDADWHYYLLIAPHSCSSPFEDQSGRVPLCAPTLINSQWTSIKPTVHSVHLSLSDPFTQLLEMLLNRVFQKSAMPFFFFFFFFKRAVVKKKAKKLSWATVWTQI